VLTETYCNKVNIEITRRDDFIQTSVCLSQLGISVSHYDRKICDTQANTSILCIDRIAVIRASDVFEHLVLGILSVRLSVAF